MEVLQEGRVTRASDVYSFAMIALEMITGAPVFEGFSSTQVRRLLLRLRLLLDPPGLGPACGIAQAFCVSLLAGVVGSDQHAHAGPSVACG
jgi:serine/threonine protein kinase